MIFFTENIKPFKAASGVTIAPCECILKSGKKGYFLGDDWRDEIEAKGIEVEEITKDQIKQEEI